MTVEALLYCALIGFQKSPLSQPMRRKTKTNRELVRTRFPALDAGNMYLLRILIGLMLFSSAVIGQSNELGFWVYNTRMATALYTSESLKSSSRLKTSALKSYPTYS